MWKGDRINIDNEEFDIYLQHFGWPIWPPKEVPQNYQWWKEEINVSPTKVHLPNKNLVEFSGVPQAGKTTIEKRLKKEIFRTGSGQKMASRIIDQDNLFTRGAEGMVSISLDLLYPSAEDDDIQITTDSTEDVDSWVGLVFSQVYKTQFWANQIRNMSSNFSPKPELVLGIRGLVDSTVFQNAIASERYDQNLTIPKTFDSFKTKLNYELVETQSMAKEQDSIILIGIDQNEAQERRRKQGKTKPSWISDSPFYNNLSAWYGYWIQNVWPIMHKEHGTGLLVLDGNKPILENIKKIKSHLRVITNAWP